MVTCLGTNCVPRSITVVVAARGRCSCSPNYPRRKVGRTVNPGDELPREEAGAPAPGVASDAPDRHVDPVARHGPVFLRFPTPEPVLPVLPGPRLAGLEDG